MDYDYDAIFEAYYNLYRAEADTPASTDDEYTIGMRLANEALNRWANYDGTYWDVLFDSLQSNGGGDQTLSTSDTTYATPVNFVEAGGSVKIKDSSGNVVQTYPILKSYQGQFLTDDSTYAYFTRGKLYYSTGTASQSATTITGSGTTWTSAMVGMQFTFASGETATITAFGSTTSLTASVSQTVTSTTYKIINTGYTLNLNPSPASTYNGYDIDYVYYKRPTEYTDGETISEIPDPYFVIHRMLASRFRASRNPYYTTAKADAENALKQMQMDNNSGSWADPWKLPDNSGSTWGS